MKKTLKHIFIGSLIILILLSGRIGMVFADVTVEVTGNGANSANSANVTQSTSTEVSSNNNAKVTNTVDSNTNTGNNSASSNTGGETVITTGNVGTQVEVKNSLNQTNLDLSNCCQSQATVVKESGNGANSQNSTTLSGNNTTRVSVNNQASVRNDVSIVANTGNNHIENQTMGEGDNTRIQTGNIKIKGGVKNVGINTEQVTVPASDSGDTVLEILKNGYDSTNIIVINNNNVTDISTVNNADIYNDIKIGADTGNNQITKGVGGNSEIITGNVDIDFSVINEHINESVVRVVCCSSTPSPSISPTPTPSTSPTLNPSTPPSNNPSSGSSTGVGGVSSSSNSSSRSPSTLGAAILPVTGGGNTPYALYFIIGLTLFMIGIGLRYAEKKLGIEWDIDKNLIRQVALGYRNSV